MTAQNCNHLGCGNKTTDPTGLCHNHREQEASGRAALGTSATLFGNWNTVPSPPLLAGGRGVYMSRPQVSGAGSDVKVRRLEWVDETSNKFYQAEITGEPGDRTVIFRHGKIGQNGKALPPSSGLSDKEAEELVNSTLNSKIRRGYEEVEPPNEVTEMDYQDALAHSEPIDDNKFVRPMGYYGKIVAAWNRLGVPYFISGGMQGEGAATVWTTDDFGRERYELMFDITDELGEPGQLIAGPGVRRIGPDELAAFQQRMEDRAAGRVPNLPIEDEDDYLPALQDALEGTGLAVYTGWQESIQDPTPEPPAQSVTYRGATFDTTNFSGTDDEAVQLAENAARAAAEETGWNDDTLGTSYSPEGKGPR